MVDVQKDDDAWLMEHCKPQLRITIMYIPILSHIRVYKLYNP